MHSHWSLVLFTLLVQSVVGSVWCIQLLLIVKDGQMDPLHLKYQLVAASGLILAGLATATAHLGKPGAGFNAARNIKHSWLSREIVAVNIFAGVLAIMTVLTCITPASLNRWFMPWESLTGGVVIYTMTRVYLVRTVPSWNHAGTPLTFLGSTLLLGAALFTLVLNLIALSVGIDHGAAPLTDARVIALLVGLIGLVFKVLGARYPLGESMPAWSTKSLQPVMQAIAVALWAVSMLCTAEPGVLFALFSAAAIILVSGEVIHRRQFYNSYRRFGL